MNMPVDVSQFERLAKPITSYRPYWAIRFGTAKFLPTSRAEMAALGWDSCDIIIVTGDAYVDHPSFGMAVIGRTLEAQGFRVGIIDQPDWQSADPFRALGKPNLFFGVTAGNMDSMINRYTADRKFAPTMPTPRAGKAGRVQTAQHLFTRSDAVRRTKTCPLSSAASRVLCAGSRTTITGKTKFADPWLLTQSVTSCCTVMPSEPSSKSPTASARGRPFRT